MATGFTQRFRGKVTIPFGGFFQNGAKSAGYFTNAGAPTSGAAGTYFGFAPKGALLVDLTNATLYQNTGTLASPTWTQLTSVGGAGAYSGSYDGTVGAVTPSTGVFTYMSESVGLALAAVGTNQGTGLQLSKQINKVATAASTAVGVILPASAAVGIGGVVRVLNDGPGNSFHVYGAGSDTIDGTSGATGVVLTNAKGCDYLLGSAGAWLSFRFDIVRSA